MLKTMTPQQLQAYKQKTLIYLNRRLNECINFLDMKPDNTLMLKRYETLKEKIKTVEEFKL